MMNFMAESSNQGFCGEDQNQNQILMSSSTAGGKFPFFSSCSTSSSSSSSSQLHKSLAPLTFHHHHHHHQHQLQQSNWLESQQPLAEEINCMWGQRVGVSKPDLMEDDAATVSADDDNDGRRADSSSEGLGLGVRGGGASGSGSGVMVEKEHMFDKVVTPSDVGKLNRLVIPKQHAEKYFPLDSSTNEKGLLLNFEDRHGKPWRFRYSYWNSSQSYVMTKGWSRFVKEKKLDAGDIVSFQRGVGELGKDRLFIDWRRRPDAPELSPTLPSLSHLPPHHYFSFQRSSQPWTPVFLRPPPHPAAPSSTAQRDHLHFPHLSYPSSHSNPSYNYYNNYSYSSGVGHYPRSPNSLQANPSSSNSVIYRGSAVPQQVQMQSGGGGGEEGGIGAGVPMVFESVPVVQGKAAAKRLRLFGVNMDCPISESDECDILSSTTIPLATISTHPPHLSTSPHQLRLYNGSPLPLPALQPNEQGKPSNNRPFDLDI
ncbi:hypothetical protein NMG60_11026834 [Bertholletia excelsa]